MSTCSLNGNTLTSTSDIILNPFLVGTSPGYGTGIHIKGVTGPTYYISSNNNLVIDSGGTISLSDAGSTYGSFNNQNGFTISSSNNLSLNLNSYGSNGQITLQNAGTTYGSIIMDTAHNKALSISTVGLPIGNQPLSLTSTGYFIFAIGPHPAAPYSSAQNGLVGNINMYQYQNPSDSTNRFYIDSNNTDLVLNNSSNINLSTGTIYLQNAGTTYGFFNNYSNGFTITSSNKLNLVSFSSINLCYGYNTTGDTTININTPDGSQIGGGNYCTIKTTGRGSNLEIDTAGSITFNPSSGLATNYVAPYSTTGKGIINQQALANIIPTISINNDNPNVLYLQSNNQQIPSYLQSDGRTRQYYIHPPSAVGMYFLNMTDAGHTQHTCFIVVCTSQSVNSNSYNVKDLNNGGCYVDTIVTFTPYNGVVLNVIVPGGSGGIYNWIPLLLTP